MLEDAARRASAKQPDEIHLIAAPQHAWSNPSAVEAFARAVFDLGFAEAGTFTIDALSVAIRFFLKAQENVYAAVYEHSKAGVWLNFVILYEIGTSMTFTTRQDRGMEQRPGHPIVHSPGASAAQLYAMVQDQAPPAGRKPLSEESIAGEFERAWAEGILWRKDRGGISVTEAASVLASRNGQPARILRPDRIQYIAEQDGVPERGLKEEFTKCFAQYPGVEKAYLVYLRYDEMPECSVALCLISKSKDLKLIEAIRRAFSALFSKTQHLDIMFVSLSEAQRIERVCPPFYSDGA
jgi:hypothetical protein